MYSSYWVYTICWLWPTSFVCSVFCVYPTCCTCHSSCMYPICCLFHISCEWVGGQIKFSSPQKSHTTCCACSVTDISLVRSVKNRRTLNKKNGEPSWLYLAFYSWAFPKTQTYRSLRMLYIWYKFGCEMWVMKALYFENNEPSSLYLTFYSRHFSETQHFVHYAHVLQ